MAIVGSFLNDLQRKVDNYIELVSFRKEDGMTPFELNAARALGIAIENTKNYLSESLETTQDKVDTVAQSRLNELESYVQALEQKTTKLFTMETLATDYVKSLFHPNLPKLETIEPKQIDLQKKFEVTTVCFLGNFNCASNRYPPSLKINGVALMPSRIDPDCLSFSIVPDQINPANTAFISGVLTVPRKVGWCCSGKIVKSHFTVWIGNFPKIPNVNTELFCFKEPEAHTEVPSYVGPHGDIF